MNAERMNQAAGGGGGNEAGGGDTVVEVSHLRRSFKRKCALEDVSLTVRRGTVYGLLGENGAGKTTLMKHLLGTLRAQSGTVRVLGRDPVKEPVPVLSRIGYLSEDRDLPGWMRVCELMRYTQAFYPGWDEGYAESLRDRFELDPKARIKQLSRGEKAKAGLLAALGYRPELLLLDEPSSGLDASARRDILGAIVRTVADEGRTVIFSSHLLDEVERVADEMTMIHEGKVVLEGTVEEVKARHRRVTVHLEQPLDTWPQVDAVLHAEGGGAEWALTVDGNRAALERFLTENGGRVVEEAVPSLEQLFLARVGHRIQEGD